MPFKKIKTLFMSPRNSAYMGLGEKSGSTAASQIQYAGAQHTNAHACDMTTSHMFRRRFVQPKQQY